MSLLQVQYLFDLAISPYLTTWHQWWRIPLNQVIFVNQSEVIIAILLLYNLRVIERLIGSAKFLSLSVLLYTLNSITVPILVYALRWIPYISHENSLMRPSQVSTLFGLLWMYHSFVPQVYRFQLSPISADSSHLRVQFSDKALVYILALQLIGTSFPASIINMLTGWILCGLVQAEVLPGKNWRMPYLSKLVT